MIDRSETAGQEGKQAMPSYECEFEVFIKSFVLFYIELLAKRNSFIN